MKCCGGKQLQYVEYGVYGIISLYGVTKEDQMNNTTSSFSPILIITNLKLTGECPNKIEERRC